MPDTPNRPHHTPSPAEDAEPANALDVYHDPFANCLAEAA
jgi:hypothetical protein